MLLTRFSAMAAALMLGFAAMPASAQITADDSATLTAINSGDVTLNGSINNPQILGGSGNAFSLVSQGAVVAYDPKQKLTNEAAMVSQSGTQSVSVSISNVNVTAINSGNVNSSGTVGRQQSSANSNLSITAVGLQSGFAIATKPRG